MNHYLIKGIAILNEDDPYVIKMGDTFSGNIIGYGVNGNYTVHGVEFNMKIIVPNMFVPALMRHLKLS